MAGSGPVVVLLHSSVCDRRMWEPQWKALQDAGFRTVRLDFAGFGDSPVPQDSYDNAEDVRDLLDTLGLDEVTLVGASFGGRIAQEFAARWPGRVSRLALICAAMRDFPPTPAIREFGDAEDELLEKGDIDAAVALNVETFAGPLATEETRAFIAQMQRRAFELQLGVEGVSSRKADFDLAAITAQTLVVSGDHDVDYFGLIADHLTETIPGARRVALDWAGHLPSLESPERFNPVLLDFLAR